MIPYIAIGTGIVFLFIYRFLPVRLRISAGVMEIGPAEWTRLGMAVIVSLVVLGSAIYMILSQNYGEASEKWGFGAIGTIIGFWLRPEK